MRTAILFKFSVLFILISFLACGPSGSTEKGDDALSGDIKVDGSSTVYPVTEAVAEEFRSVAPKVRITVGVSGTGGGFKKFCRGETDISDASRPIKQKEIDACGSANIAYLPLTVAFDGMAVLINPENKWVDKFTVEELKKIWEPEAQGKILKWNQIRPEWPDEEIHLFGPGVASGTFDYFTEAICGKSGSSRGDYTASEDDNVLVQGIATDKYALGFFGLAYYEENKDKLSLAPVDNGSGAILPSMATVKDGSYAPLSRPLYIYVNSEATKKPHVVKFIRYYLDTVSELVGSVGYIPLPDAEYASQSKKFEDFLAKNK
jgi:phosphate transport system substrate-binding protein